MTNLWQGVSYVHLLAMAFFVGGQLLVAVAVVPVERRNPDPDRLRAIAALRGRLGGGARHPARDRHRDGLGLDLTR